MGVPAGGDRGELDRGVPDGAPVGALHPRFLPHSPGRAMRSPFWDAGSSPSYAAWRCCWSIGRCSIGCTGGSCFSRFESVRQDVAHKSRLETGRRERCFRMIPARARNASLASPELGNAAATSGSSTTTALPAAYRDAYLFGVACLKSYSGRISSGSAWSEILRLVVDLFIVFSFTPCGTSCTDNSNSLAPVDVHDCKQIFAFRKTQQYEPLFLASGHEWGVAVLVAAQRSPTGSR